MFQPVCLSVSRLSQRVGRILTKPGGRIGSVTRTSRLDFGSSPEADLAYQWATKRKLFSRGRQNRFQSTRFSIPTLEAGIKPESMPSPSTVGYKT